MHTDWPACVCRSRLATGLADSPRRCRCCSSPWLPWAVYGVVAGTCSPGSLSCAAVVVSRPPRWTVSSLRHWATWQNTNMDINRRRGTAHIDVIIYIVSVSVTTNWPYTQRDSSLLFVSIARMRSVCVMKEEWCVLCWIRVLKCPRRQLIDDNQGSELRLMHRDIGGLINMIWRIVLGEPVECRLLGVLCSASSLLMTTRQNGCKQHFSSGWVVRLSDYPSQF